MPAPGFRVDGGGVS